MPSPPALVRCGRCREELDASMFSPSQRRNGRSCRPCAAAYQAERRAACPRRRLDSAMGAAVYKALRGGKAGRAWEDLVGYTLADLVEHIEYLFRPGMSWRNYGAAWHVDHATPVSWHTYDSPGDPEFLLCWSLSNLQPLPVGENLAKKDTRACPPAWSPVVQRIEGVPPPAPIEED